MQYRVPIKTRWCHVYKHSQVIHVDICFVCRLQTCYNTIKHLVRTSRPCQVRSPHCYPSLTCAACVCLWRHCRHGVTGRHSVRRSSSAVALTDGTHAGCDVKRNHHACATEGAAWRPSWCKSKYSDMTSSHVATLFILCSSNDVFFSDERFDSGQRCSLLLRPSSKHRLTRYSFVAVPRSLRAGQCLNASHLLRPVTSLPLNPRIVKRKLNSLEHGNNSPPHKSKEKDK